MLRHDYNQSFDQSKIGHNIASNVTRLVKGLVMDWLKSTAVERYKDMCVLTNQKLVKVLNFGGSVGYNYTFEDYCLTYVNLFKADVANNTVTL